MKRPTRKAKPDDPRKLAMQDALALIDARLKQIEEIDPDADNSFRGQELRTEARMLRQLRTATQAEITSPTFSTTDPHWLRLLRLRTRELREQLTASAEDAERAGDYRAARSRRLDAIRAWELAEYDYNLRSGLAGYSSQWV